MKPDPESLQPTQLGLPFFGKRVNINGLFDEKRQVTYLGDATHVFDRTYRCLANVRGALCVVEVEIQ